MRAVTRCGRVIRMGEGERAMSRQWDDANHDDTGHDMGHDDWDMWEDMGADADVGPAADTDDADVHSADAGDRTPTFEDAIDPHEPGKPKLTPEELAAKRKKDNRRFFAMLAAMSALLIIGVGLILYPTIADAWNRHVSSRAVAGYIEKVADTSKEDREKELARAKEYNESLIGQGNSRFLPTPEEKKVYDSILDVSGTGIMGYVTIPKIKARLPIYHGTEETVLQIAAGHLEGSSLPIGGESTHTVLTGHTGLPSAMLFTGLDTLDKGDKFTITVYDEVLTYEVEATHTVLPKEVKDLAIQEGRDLASLVTCTPYGVNSHRLIVTGHRIPTESPQQHIPYRDEGLTQDIAATTVIAAVVIAAIVTVFVVQRRRLRNQPMHHAKR